MVKSFEITRTEGETPVILATAKKHLRIEPDYTEDDDSIETYLAAAVDMAENYVGHALYESRVFFLNDFSNIEFEAWADASLTSIGYLPADGDGEAYTDLPTENYAFRKVGSSTCAVAFKGTLPDLLADSDIAVKVTVGTTCPAAVVSGILLMLGDLYERREDRGEVGTNKATEALWRPYKKWA